MLKLLHIKQIKNCTKSASTATMKNTNGAVAPDTGATPINYCLKSESFFFNYFQLGTYQDLVENHLYNQGNHYEKYGRFPLCMQRKPSHATSKLTIFAVSKDEWNTKEDTC